MFGTLWVRAVSARKTPLALRKACATKLTIKAVK